MNVKINTEVLELFIYYWQATADREKVSDIFLTELAARKELKVLFNEDFTQDSIRKVLSSITNREILSEKTKTEGRFWNNNMWMLEDLGITMGMLTPIKKLNGEQFNAYVNKDITINFIPGHIKTFYVEGNQLYINFFKLSTDFGTGEVEIEGKNLEDFIKEILLANK
ncbi:MAG: hypothetical protein PHQ32_07470 [Firmicutes bacterium]|nr:hypothetical protein [Bacillota bacterium]